MMSSYQATWVRSTESCAGEISATRRVKCAVPVASVEELKRHRIDIGYRDFCAHMLIGLNQCRHETYYMPWKCTDERHAYEKCQYIE